MPCHTGLFPSKARGTLLTGQTGQPTCSVYKWFQHHFLCFGFGVALTHSVTLITLCPYWTAFGLFRRVTDCHVLYEACEIKAVKAEVVRQTMMKRTIGSDPSSTGLCVQVLAVRSRFFSARLALCGSRMSRTARVPTLPQI